VIDLAGGADRVLRGDPAVSPIRSVVVVEITGEGAQDIVAGVPGATAAAKASAGVLCAVYSPRLTASRQVTSITAAQGASVTASLNINNVGTMTIRWAARSDSSWLSLSPATGSTSAGSPGQLTLSASPGSLPTGTYHGGLTYVSQSGDLLWAETIEVDLTVTPGTTTAPAPTNP